MRIAVVGSGIGGIGSAWLLSGAHRVDVYEAEPQLGGHTCTVDVTPGGTTFPVDTGFMVFNRRTYPNLTRFFEHLGVEAADADMSFSVQVPSEGIEWSSDIPGGIFAQRRNIANPRFLGMLRDIVRLSRDADRFVGRPRHRKAYARRADCSRGLRPLLHGVVPRAYGSGHLVDSARPHARVPGQHLPSLL